MAIWEGKFLANLDWFFFIGMNLRTYPFALAVCVVLCAALAWNAYANRVSAFAFSFSGWFALQWAFALVSLLSGYSDGRFDFFVIGLAVLSFIVFFLFGVCGSVSLWLYVSNKPIEPESAGAFRIGVMLLTAHMLHFLILTFLFGLS
ncbi:MAG: hypothetical protein K8S25_11910 [Alphaproteobacteria bacterium]|nr:hypothetical protein [Alphaproteobacteria bacterium]